jgi:hypothetical protein
MAKTEKSTKPKDDEPIIEAPEVPDDGSEVPLGTPDANAAITKDDGKVTITETRA